MRSLWLRGAAVVCLVAFLAGCSETEPKKPGTPPGTYTIAVNATSGNLVRQTTLTLTVK